MTQTQMDAYNLARAASGTAETLCAWLGGERGLGEASLRVTDNMADLLLYRAKEIKALTKQLRREERLREVGSGV